MNVAEKVAELRELEEKIADMQHELYVKGREIKKAISEASDADVEGQWTVPICDGGCIIVSPVPPCSGCCVRKSSTGA